MPRTAVYDPSLDLKTIIEDLCETWRNRVTVLDKSDKSQGAWAVNKCWKELWNATADARDKCSEWVPHTTICYISGEGGPTELIYRHGERDFNYTCSICGRRIAAKWVI